MQRTPQIEGHTIREYKGIVTGETIIGANMFKDLFAGIRDIVGGFFYDNDTISTSIPIGTEAET